MLALALVLAQVPTTPSEIAERLFQSDISNFMTDEKNFGIRRIAPRKVGSHYVAGHWPDGVSRFLVGNVTKPFNAKEFRVQHIARHPGYEYKDPANGKMVKVAPDKAPKELSDEAIGKLIKLHFGSEFRQSVGGQDVFGYRVNAVEKCLSCHTWAKKGDALGYLVYGVTKKAP